ncbi:MAG: murein biosynthesis integral membrane protein MurJ, partial [Verrucomicrobia bacterium]|nr:murein biosynthesis integral membrane protein MurJ [Verrucomicrobiota bacterium]
MEAETIKKVSKGALAFFSGTLISRVSGLGRDMSLAFCFGSHPAIAAFMVAYRFSNLFRRLIGEGSLPAGFVPHFEDLRKDHPQEGARFFRDVFFSALFFLVGLILLLCLGVGAYLHYANMSDSVREILFMTLLMLPGLLFICLYAVSSALLQCERKFFLSGIAPLCFNVTWILTAFFFRDAIPEQAAIALSLAVVVGFFLQWLFLFPSLKSYLRTFLSWKEIGRFRLFSLEVRRLVKPFSLGLIGVSATQVNSLMDAIFARCASLEGPAYLWYAIRIHQLPIALFGIALASALLPPLSQAASKQEWDDFHALLRYSFIKSFHFIFPCVIALFVLAACGVNLLYGRGDFSQEATTQTVLCLWGYSAGLLPAVFVLLLAPAFYAQKNFRTPMQAAVLSMAINIFLNAAFVFVFELGAVSIALSTSFSAWFNCWFLQRALKQQKWLNFDACKGSLCALASGSITLLLGHFLIQDPTISILLQKTSVVFPRTFVEQALNFFVLSGTFCL